MARKTLKSHDMNDFNKTMNLISSFPSVYFCGIPRVMNENNELLLTVHINGK